MNDRNLPRRSVSVVRVRLIPEAVVCYDPIAAEYDHAAGIAAALLTGLPREHLVAVHVDSLGMPLSAEFITAGALAISLLHPREVFTAALLANAAGVYLAQNRVVCGPEPTDSDLSLAKRLMEAGELLGIPLLEHEIRDGAGASCSLLARLR